MWQEGFQLLHQLPEELLQDVLSRLDPPALSGLACTSKWTYPKAAAWIWRDVKLKDCRTTYPDWDGYDKDASWDREEEEEEQGGDGENVHVRRERFDEHDDTAIIRKLVVLASKPWIAEFVHTLTHSCHLPPPAIHDELPHAFFSSQTLSVDPRTLRLAHLACYNMSRLHTLRIIFGHPSLNDTILRALFDRDRPRETPIRRLWLENCRVSSGCESFDGPHPSGLQVPLQLDFSGLESVRLRRMPLRSGISINAAVPIYTYIYARCQEKRALQNGAGGSYTTTMNPLGLDQLLEDYLLSPEETRDSLFALAMQFDDKIYDRLAHDLSPEQLTLIQEGHVPAHAERCRQAYRGPYLDPLSFRDATHNDFVLLSKRNQREISPSASVAVDLLKNASDTLTSLCLDWVHTAPGVLGSSREPDAPREWYRIFARLFSLRFPHLRAFQVRNAITPGTMIPPGLLLLDHSRITVRNRIPNAPETEYVLDDDDKENLDLACLKFMEAHSNLHCLAWPMDSIFAESAPPADIAQRVENVIANLARSLVDLRVDVNFSGHGEVKTEQFRSRDPDARERRHRFIELFALKMTKVESIKIEGSLPRDEQRELIRALNACPISKLVVIGESAPLGNTWGFAGEDLGEPLSPMLTPLEAENKAAIHEFAFKDLNPMPPDVQYRPTYGWPAGPPQLHNIASCFADSITALKFCGYKGAPCLLQPTPITEPMLYPLKHFRKLESLVLSVWLNTHFEGEPRDHEIIKYWMDARTPASTALVRVTDEEPEGWERELLTKFSPDALAWRITSLIGQYLSDEAKQRPGGVRVRASFCIGDWGGIFDVDVRVGYSPLGSKLLGYTGPREEVHPDRTREKLESRRWF